MLKPLRTPVPVAPQPLFALEPYDLEHRPSIDRQRSGQEAMLAEAKDEAIPVDARLRNLRRMRDFADRLIETLTTGGDLP